MSNINHWSKEETADFSYTFLAWYEREKRDLPWRENKDPYRIWVSEIMLQQTRVDTVIPYFLNFMTLFPTIQALAEAPEDTLLKAWEGLGYYSRVRNLQKAAIQIVENFDGKMPRIAEEISTLKGIGPYTTGAIASMAYGLPTPAVDGNVMRVVSRLFEISDDIAKPKSRKIFEETMQEIISRDNPGDFNQAMMDLGSSTCTPTKPSCNLCPINEFCQSYAKGTVGQFPVKSKKVKAKPVYYVGMIIKNEKGEFLLEKRPAEGLLANMWIFPLFPEEMMTSQLDVPAGGLHEVTSGETQQIVLNQLQEAMNQKYQLYPTFMKRPLPEIKHIFTHLKWFIACYYGQVDHVDLTNLPENCEFVHPENFEKYTFPGPQQKMLAQYQKNIE